ncbi:MAG: Beta-barrel assembly-enhancing protease [Verrucomicrobia subdivision 3 bacterium]|nr:Beta-barrel assembly-enhancing protease [Limisphaerales bacterium]MCS1414732.1 Beta-barrel assembly-enhancing protease [Limisphaerales bacterium]
MNWLHLVKRSLVSVTLPLLVSQVAAQATKLDEETRLQFWSNPEFVKRFMASYGFNTEIEPRFETPEEQMAFKELGDVIRESPSEAMSRLQKMITPTSSAVLPFTMGALYFQEGESAKAIEQFELAITKFPDFRRAHRNMGFALAQEGRYDEATKSLTKALNLGAVDASIYGLLGFSYLNEGKNLSAEAAYLNAILLDPENQDWKLGLIKSNIARFNYSQALALLDEVLAENPESASLWSLQANVYLQMEDNRRAAVNLEMLRKMGKATLANLMLLGDIYMLDEALELALPVYLNAIEQDGVNDIRRSLRATEILVDRGAWVEADQLFAKIKQFHGDSISGEEEAKLLRLESKVAIANGEGDKALQVLEQIITKNPLDGEALLLAGEFYSQEGKSEEAIFRYDLAAKINGYEADAWLKHAQLLVRQQEYNEALELLRKAQKVKPRDNVQKYLEAVERVARASTG